MPVYNGMKYLRYALDSILQQNYTDFELIISDNASTDATQNICLEYAEKDNRIRYHRNETNIGATSNFNRVLELARGEFFKWAAHDDVHLPGFLRRCIEVIESAPATVVLVTPKAVVIDEHGKNVAGITVENLDTRNPQPNQRVANVMRKIFWASAQYGLFRVEALKKTRLIGPFYASDNVFLAEVAALGQIWEIPELLFQARYHPDMSARANKGWRSLQDWFEPSGRDVKRIFPPFFRTGIEYLCAFAQMHVSMQERFLCCLNVFTVWYPRQFRILFHAWRNKIGLRTRLKKIFTNMSGRFTITCQ